MAKTPRAFLAPSLYPPDRYRLSLMSAAVPSQTLTSAVIGLYNNGQRGRYLFVYGVQVFASLSSSNVIWGVQQSGKLSGGTDVVTYPVKFDEALIEGVVTYKAGAGGFPAGSYVLLGQTLDGSYYWPYQYPVAIIPPGMSFVVNFSGSSVPAGASFQWYSGEPFDEVPLVTMDVEDFAG
jgi:hypothetical protein